MSETEFDAFISYNHAADARLAEAVERGLERLAKPWYRLRALSVIRDMSDTGLNAGLWPTVQRQLDASRWLIVLACPESAASPWVTQEVEHWSATKGVDNVLLVLTGGEIVWDRATGAFSPATTALAPDFARRFEHEPLHLDLRWTRDVDEEPSLALARFRSEMARLAAPLHGRPPAEIEGEDIRLHRAARRLARAAVAIVAVLAVAAGVAAVMAVASAREADRNAREAVARQIGLLALDMPASKLDEAMLLSAVSASLDPNAGVERFRASRTLLGRYARLTTLLPVPNTGGISLRGVAVSDDGASAAATAWPSGGEPVLLRWDLRRGGEPTETALPDTTGAEVTFVDHDHVAVGTIGDLLVDPATGADRGRIVSIDPDGQRAVVADGERVALVDLVAGTDLAGWPGQRAVAAIDHDHSVVVIGSALRMVDAVEGHVLALTTVTDDIAAVAVDRAPDGTNAHVVTVSGQGHVSSWRLLRDELAPSGADPVEVTVGEPRGLAVGPGATFAIVVGTGGSAMVDLVNGRTIATDVGAGRLSVAPSRRFAAVGGTRLTIWDLTTGQRMESVPEKVSAMSWSRCGTGPCRLVTAGEAVDVWEPAVGRRIRLAEQSNAQTVDITADGSTVVSAGWGASVAVWTLTVPIDHSGRAEVTAAGSPSAFEVASGAIARHTDGDAVSVTLDDTTTSLATGPVTTMQLLDGGTRLLTLGEVDVGGGGERAIGLFRVADGSHIVLDAACAGELVATSPRGRRLVVHRSTDGRTVVCDTGDGSLVAGTTVADIERSPVTAVAVDDHGAVVLGRHGHVDYHRIDDWRLQRPGAAIDVSFGGEPVVVRSLTVNRGSVAAGIEPAVVEPSASGREVARVLVWDAANGGDPVQFDSDHPEVVAVALLGDEAELLVTAGRSGPGGDVILQVWETDGRRRLGRGLEGLVGDVVTLGGDVTTVFGTDVGGRTFRWALDRDPRREVCDIVGRALTAQEWSAVAGGVLGRYRFDPVCEPATTRRADP